LVLSGLDRLPLELIDLVLSELDCVDLMYFGFSLPHMWPLAYRHVETKYHRSTLSPWARTNVITVGEDMPRQGTAQRYPPGLLTNADYAELENGITKAEAGYHMLDEADAATVIAPVNLHRLADARYHEARVWEEQGLFSLFLKTDMFDYIYRVGNGDPLTRRLKRMHALRMMRDFRYFKLVDFYPPDQTWILRNLTAKQIVRADSLAALKQLEQQEGSARFGLFVKGRVTFGCVVFARTSWSTYEPDEGHDAETYTALDYSNRRGVWAGHCFDITTTQRHHQQLQAMDAEERAAWRDVSEEVAAEMKIMWNYSGSGDEDED
jgi:hypothetical protein